MRRAVTDGIMSTVGDATLPLMGKDGGTFFAVLFHASTNLFAVSPVVTEVGDQAFLVLAAVAKWALVGVMIAVAGTGLARGPRPETLPNA
jgi:hypothetical protein